MYLYIANFIALPPHGVREKRYKFLHINYFGAPGGTTWPKFTNLGGDVHQSPLYQAA